MGEDIAKLALTVPKDATLLGARIVPRQHWPIPQGLPACFFSHQPFGSSPSEERESPEPTFSNTTSDLIYILWNHMELRPRPKDFRFGGSLSHNSD